MIFLFFLPLILLCVFTGLLFLMYTVYQSHPEDAQTRTVALSFAMVCIGGIYLGLGVTLIELGGILVYVGMVILMVWIGILGKSILDYMYSSAHLKHMGAIPLTDPHIIKLIREMAHTFRIPPPDVYITHYEVPNAFTLGRKKEPKLIVTDGLLDLNLDEVKAVFAHELVHIKNNDSLVKTVASAMRSLLFFDPVVRRVYARIYVEKEFVADKISVLMTRNPGDLVSALRKIYKEVLEFGEGLPSQSVLNFSQKIYSADSLRRQQGIPSDPILRNRFIVERKMMPGSVVKERVKRLTEMEKKMRVHKK